MPTARRTRVLAAGPDAVWRVAGDPNHQPRWWPKVQRVEAVERDAFTRVYGTAKGRPVRADFLVAERGERRVVWRQRIEDTPFERILQASDTVVAVEPASEGGTRVTLEVRQRLRGLSKLGGFLVKRATRKQLDEALDALEGVV